MTQSRQIYDLLLNCSQSPELIQEVIIGLTWTMCRTSQGIGLCMSPGTATRTLTWSGTLVDQPLEAVTPWIRAWDAYQATVGMAAINAAINCRSPLIEAATPIGKPQFANLAVFEYFLPQIRGQKVVIIGRYPRLSQYEKEMDMLVIERQPGEKDLPDPACEYYVPQADWVFLTATSIPNKTFPRLVELAESAKLVLMGPTLPWLPELAEMGINYLAGVKVTDSEALRQTVAEGGGVRIFETGVQYCVLEL